MLKYLHSCYGYMYVKSSNNYILLNMLAHRKWIANSQVSSIQYLLLNNNRSNCCTKQLATMHGLLPANRYAHWSSDVNIHHKLWPNAMAQSTRTNKMISTNAIPLTTRISTYINSAARQRNNYMHSSVELTEHKGPAKNESNTHTIMHI